MLEAEEGRPRVRRRERCLLEGTLGVLEGTLGVSQGTLGVVFVGNATCLPRAPFDVRAQAIHAVDVLRIPA